MPREMASASSGIVTVRVIKLSNIHDAKNRRPPAVCIRVEVGERDFFRTRAIPTRNGVDYVFLVGRLWEVARRLKLYGWQHGYLGDLGHDFRMNNPNLFITCDPYMMFPSALNLSDDKFPLK